ncbi:FeoA family protein [Amnibacterium endophyticum]|uniref:Ferrous iron transport protein A n=1 Tax=Amnibacterium endophyticum TaxID=2109337 RepID=A0ABW4LBD2_9MICO
MSLHAARLHERAIPSAAARHEDGSLADLPCGRCSVVTGLSAAAPGAVVRRLFDLGFVPGAEVEAIRRAPMGDPLIVTVAGYEIALRREQARLIDVSPAA